MRVIKIILLILVVIFAGYAIWMATIDGNYDVKRSTTINASPEVVYATVSDFSTWPKWSPWFERDSTMKAQFNEQTQGVGASYSWSSENQGSGRMEIVEADPGKSMKTAIVFDGMGGSNGFWTFEDNGNGDTKVTWGFKGEMPFFFRFWALGMEDNVGPDFEAGLANMKELIESAEPQTAENYYEFEEINLQSMNIYYTHHEIPWSEMSSEMFGASYGAIGEYLGEDMKNIIGAPMAIYHEWDEENQTTVMDIAMPCMSEKPGNETVMKGMSPEGMMVRTTYYGAYDQSEPAYMAMDEYLKNNGYEEKGTVMEVYVTGPASEPDTTQWMTEIYFAVSKK